MIEFEYLKDYCNLHVIANSKLQFFRIDNKLYQIPGAQLVTEQRDDGWYFFVWNCTKGASTWLRQDIEVVPVNITVHDNGPIYDEDE